MSLNTNPRVRIFKSLPLCILLLFCISQELSAQNCSVNAGIGETICENTPFNLSGSSSGNIQSGPVWSQVSGPSVIIDNPSDVNSPITGLLGGNSYAFRLSADCTDGSTQFQDVTITVQPITIADAGEDIASCPDSSGNITVSANAPGNTGETGEWIIVGNNNAGININFPNSPTTTLDLPETSAGVTTLQWTITGLSYGPGQFCESTDTVTVTNYGGEQSVSAGPDQSLDKCYTVTQSTSLNASFGGNNLNSQQGTWSFVSGPSTPDFADVNNNITTISNLIEGSYTLRWTVVGQCASGQDTMVITVDKATQDVTNATVANSTIQYCDASITTATLEGAAPEFSGETVQWTQTEGTTASILNDTNSTTQLTGLSDTGGPYTFVYTITNTTTGCEDSAAVQIIYSTTPITITGNGGADIIAECGFTEVDVPYVTTGNGSNSYAIISGPAASALVDSDTFTSFSTDPLTLDFDVEGTYAVQLRRAVGGSVQTGCNVGNDVINITISRPPAGSNAGTPQNLSCNVTGTALAGNNPAIGTTFWSQVSGPNSASISDAYISNPGISSLIPGIYVFKYTVTGGVGCSPPAESIVSVEVSSDASITIDAGPDQTACFGTAVQLAGEDPPAPNLVGTWTVDLAPVGATIVFEDENDPNTTVSGLNDVSETYRFLWTVGNPNDATCPPPGSDTVTITTNATQGPTAADAGLDQCLLSGTTTVNLAGNEQAVDESGVWTAVPNIGLSFNDPTQFDTTASITIEQSYILTWTIDKTAPGCQSSSGDVEITIGDPAVADAGADQTDCSSTFDMAAATSPGGSGVWTQLTGPGGVTIDDDTSPTAQFIFLSSGEYTFEWTVNNGNCSSDSDQITLVVGIPPTAATAGTDQQVCNATNTILTGNAFNGDIETGYWSLLSGAPNTPNITDVNDPNSAVTNLVTGSYTFRWTIAGSPTCPSTFDDVVVDVSAPANAGADLDLCEVTNFLLEATFGSTGTWTQLSTTGPNATITQNPVNSNVAEVAITPGNTYVFRFTTDYSSCPNLFDDVTVTSSTKPSVNPNAGSDQILCRADLAPFNTTMLTGNMAPLDVDVATWRFASEPSGSVAVINIPNNNLTTLSGLSVPGIYILEWNFSSGNCSDTADVVRIEVYEAPSTAAAGVDQPDACQIDVQMDATPPAIGIGTWTLTSDPSSGDALIDSPNSPTTTLSNITTLGTYELTWTVTNGTTFSSGSCAPSVDTVDITFTDVPPSTPEAGPDQQFCDATQTNLDATVLVDGTGTWSQTVGPGVSTAGTAANITAANNPKTLVLDLEPGLYEFTWTAENGGCSLTDVMEIEIIGQPVTADAGTDQNLEQFANVTLNAVAPSVGTGIWTQVSGPTTASFVDESNPNTDVFGTDVGTYEFQWTVSNGICADVSDTMTVTIVGKADMELTKSVSPSSVNAGDTVTFTISLFNNDVDGQSDATGISVRDVVPNGYSVVLGSVSDDGVYNPGNLNITWSDLSVVNGNTLNLTFDATVNSSGSYDNSAEIIAADQFDPDSSVNNNIGTEDDQDAAAVSIQSADVSLVKTVSPTQASVGDLVTFTLTVSNGGTADATGVAVSDIVPDGYTIATINDLGARSGSTINWSGLSVTASGATAVSFTATVDAPTGTTDEYNNVAQITASDQADPDSSPNNDDGDQSEDDESSSSITLQGIDLELSKTLSPTTGNVGDEITVTINLGNDNTTETGNGTGITVVEQLPDGFDIVGGTISNGGVYNPGNLTITWSNLTVANGADLDLTYDVTINGNGNYTSIAEIAASDLPDTDSTPNNAVITEDDYATASFTIAEADLSLVKDISSGSSAAPNIGETVVFELTITNAGPNTATNVSLEDFVPRGYTLTTTNNGGTAIAGTFLSWNIASIPVGNTTVSYEVTVRAPSGDIDEYLNTAEIAGSDQADPNSETGNDDGDQSEDDEDFFEVVPQVIDLELEVSVSDNNPNVGDTVTFSIAISNNGSALADGVAIQDIIPAGFGNITIISNGGATSGNNIDWSGLSVPVGTDTLILTFTAEVLPPTGVTDEYQHIAQVTNANQFDNDSTPNNDNGDQSEDDEDSVSVEIQEADLSIVKTSNSAAPNVNDTVRFTLTITNSSRDNATGVSIIDILPSGFNLIAANNGGLATGNTASWSGLTVLGNGGSVSLTYDATVNAPTGATNEYLNAAQITASDQYDPDSNPLTDATVDEDGNGDGDDDDETTLNLVPAVGDLSLTKIVVDNDINPNVGSEISFEITVFSDGPNAAQNVEVEDILPSGFDFILYSATSGIYNETSGLWRVGDIPSGDSETLVIDVLVNASGSYTNVAEVIASDVFDSDSAPNNNVLAEDDQDNVVVSPVDFLDLSLQKTVNNATPDVGDNITFALTVTNDGPSEATNVQVMDLLPTGFAYVGDTSGGDYNYVTGNWNIGSLVNGATTSINIEVTVNPTGDYINNAEVISHNELDTDSTPNNNVLTEDDQEEVVVVPRDLVDISVTKSSNTLTPDIGSSIVFTVTVTNDGPSDASEVVVTDLLESGYSFIGATASTGSYDPLNGSWTVGNLPNGVTENIVITSTVLSTGSYTNTAELTDLEEFDIDSEAANNDATEDDQASVNPMPVLVSDLSLEKIVDNTAPRVGENVEFTINLTNLGPNDARGVVVNDQIPSGYTYSSHNATAGIYDEDTGIWNLNRVVFNNTTETLNVVVTVNPSGDYNNVAEITASDNNDPNSTPNNNILSENDQDSENTVPIPIADLSLTKTVDNEFPDVSDNVTFTLTLTNDGPSEATGIVVTDALESGYAYVSDDGGGTYNPTTGLWNVGSLASGTSVSVAITVAINTTGSYDNSAEITAVNELDPNSTPDNGLKNEDDQASQRTLPRVITDISVEKTVDNSNPSVGNEIVFTVSVTNDGPSDATGVIIEDFISSGYNFIGAVTSAGVFTEGVGSWDVGDLANGTTETLEITVIVLQAGNYANIAELIALDTFDPDSTADNNLNSEDDQDTVNPQPTGLADLSLTKEVDTMEPNVGEIVEFTLNVTNSGDSDATGVVVTDTLPVGYTYVSHVTTIGVYNEVSGLWSTNGTIPNGTTETLLISAEVNAPTGAEMEYLNIAEITYSDQSDPDSEFTVDSSTDDYLDGIADDDEASAFVVPQVTDIAVDKTVSNTTPRIGQEVVFTITATNSGAALATNIGIEDILPSGYRFIAAQASSGAYDTLDGFWSIDSLNSQVSETLEITVEVLEQDNYMNTASLKFVDQIDLYAANDSSEAKVTPGCLHAFNEFSPNGDGVNETFKIDCISRYPNNILKVYNRWGNIVFEKKGYDNGWGGTSNGRATINGEKELPVGTYFYILDLGDGSEAIQDWIYINR